MAHAEFGGRRIGTDAARISDHPKGAQVSVQIPLIEVPVLQRVLRPPKPARFYLLATYRTQVGSTDGYWKIWSEQFDSPEKAEGFSVELSTYWTHISILGPVVLT
jgi:hypothetical protein